MKGILTVISLVFIIWYFSTQVDWDTLLAKHYAIKWEYFWLGTLLALISNWLDAVAWHRILIFLNKRIRVIDAIITHMIGFTLGILIPVAGTVELGTKVVLLKRRYPELTSEQIISSIVAIRTVFLVTAYLVWAFLIISLGLEGVIDPMLSLIILLIVWFLLTIVIVVLITIFSNIDRFIPESKLKKQNIETSSLLHKFFYKTKIWLRNFAQNFQQILKMSKKEKLFMLVAVFSQNIIKWFSVYYIFLAVIDLPFFVVMISSVLGGFVNLVPAAIPGLVGLREIAAQWSVTIFINDPNLSLVAAAVQSIGLWLFFGLSGLVAIPYFFLALKDKKEHRGEMEVQNLN